MVLYFRRLIVILFRGLFKWTIAMIWLSMPCKIHFCIIFFVTYFTSKSKFFVNRFLAYFVEWYANYMLFPKWLLCSVSIFQEMTCVLHMQLCMEFILHASLKLWKFAMSKHFELDHFWKYINTLNLNSRNWYPNMNRSTL